MKAGLRYSSTSVSSRGIENLVERSGSPLCQGGVKPPGFAPHMKPVLIFPKIEPYKDHHHLPIGSLAVAGSLAARGVDSEIWDERVGGLDRFDQLIKDGGSMGITMFTGYQTHSGYELLKRAKRVNPDIVTVVGGPHATALPDQTRLFHP